jgi:hypothetical protein
MLEAHGSTCSSKPWGVTHAASRVASSRVASSREDARSASSESHSTAAPTTEGAAEVDAVDDLVYGRDVTVPR